MLKMYLPVEIEGGSPEYWEAIWTDQSFDRAVRYAAMNPLTRLIDNYAKPGTRFLEGGCGMANFVAHYSAAGVKAVGLDFALTTLAKAGQYYRDVMLCAGDVAQLPFRDESFDTYYSGGVVEHFEAGPMPALREAHRVIRRGGAFLVSVPYYNPLRRMLRPAKRYWRQVGEHSVDGRNGGAKEVFFQYCYRPREFEKLLVDAGFQVLSRRGYSILWGLYDVPGVESAVQRVTGRPTAVAGTEAGSAASSGTGPGSPRGASEAAAKPAKPGLMRRLMLTEDDTIAVAGTALRFMRWAVSNMIMFECVRN